MNDIPPTLDHPAIFHETREGTPYAVTPGVLLLAWPRVAPLVVHPFLADFGAEFDGYLTDLITDVLPPGATLAKLAGQLCYLSFGPTATKNADAARYFANIRAQGHGSILEHANYSMLFYGVGRDVTHELVRHRAGFAYSQVSQRYVGADRLRFVERLEFQGHEVLHDAFCDRIDDTRRGYMKTVEELAAVIDTQGMSRTEARKALQQAGRACLTNEVEAPILVTGNARAWRHCIAMRASRHADLAIRRPIFQAGMMLKEADPLLFGDFEPDPANFTLTSSTPKV